MCGRATYKLTWEEIVALYRLTLDQSPGNARARYNVCQTTTTDTIVASEGKRTLGTHAVGLGAVVVVEAAQGTKARDIQRMAASKSLAQARIVVNNSSSLNAFAAAAIARTAR
jgi:putative SOS response-associated peptidase YedK